jgi:hypothetical protein
MYSSFVNFLGKLHKSACATTAVHTSAPSVYFANLRARPILATVLGMANVKEHATLSARASVDHGVEVETTGEHVNRAADRRCSGSAC